MSRIRGKDTKPELLLRRALHARGLRYRLNVRTLPGRPDLVFPAARAVVFMHGCFWHRHNCARFKWPATRKAFWNDKLGRNAARDARVLDELRGLEWRTLVVWECTLTGPRRLSVEVVASRVAAFLKGTRLSAELGSGPRDGRRGR